MGRSKNKGPNSPAAQKTAAGTYVLDKRLAQQIQNYAQHHSLEDIDSVAEDLRQMHKVCVCLDLVGGLRGCS
jgi:hypothetical protein